MNRRVIVDEERIREAKKYHVGLRVRVVDSRSPLNGKEGVIEAPGYGVNVWGYIPCWIVILDDEPDALYPLWWDEISILPCDWPECPVCAERRGA